MISKETSKLSDRGWIFIRFLRYWGKWRSLLYISTLNSEEANLFQKTYYKAHKYACATKRAVLSIKSMEKLECLQSDFLSTNSSLCV